MTYSNSNFWAGRRVLVTGASGIVGSWVVKELLSRSAEVVALVLDANPQTELYRSGDINQVNVVNGRLEDFSAVERAVSAYAVDTVIHLGAQAIVDVARMAPLATFEANVRGTWNVLEVCRQQRATVERVVVASSDKAYGAHVVLPYTEGMALQGTFPYEVSKSCADLIARSYFATYELPVAVARCGNIYGGGDLNWSRIMPGTIRSFHYKQRPLIRSNGMYIRDYIYVKDVVNAYLVLAEHLDQESVRGEAFNFSTESRITVIEIVEEIRHLMGCHDIEPLIQNTAQGEIINQYLSAEKARNILDWSPSYTLEEGVKETIAWYTTFLPVTSHDKVIMRAAAATR